MFSQRISLNDSMHLYWKYHIGIAVLPVFYFVGSVSFGVAASYFIVPFAVAGLLAVWPILFKKAPITFWFVGMGVWVAGVILGAALLALVTGMNGTGA